MRTRLRRERQTLKEPKKPVTPGPNGGGKSEFGAVTIDFKPGPDSRERLRRLYSLLLEHAAEGQPARGGGPPEYAPAVDGAEAEWSSSVLPSRG